LVEFLIGCQQGGPSIEQAIASLKVVSRNRTRKCTLKS